MVESRIQAADALHATIANLRGASEALCNRAALEGDDLAAMLSASIDGWVERLSEVERWLEGNAGKTDEDAFPTARPTRKNPQKIFCP